MLKEPREHEYYKEVKNNVVEKYFLWKEEYCPKCDSETVVVLTVLTSRLHYFVEKCGECTGFDQTIHERQVMPFCEECEKPFSIEGNEVLLKIYDTLGKRCCEQCAPELLQEVRQWQKEH